MINTRAIWTYYKGDWHEGDVRILGAASHATWLGSLVFDGARAFEGVTPDLDLHCARVNASAEALGLDPVLPTQEIVALAQEGVVALCRRCRGLYPPDGVGGGERCGHGASARLVLGLRALSRGDPDGAADRLHGDDDVTSDARRSRSCRSMPRRPASIPTTPG